MKILVNAQELLQGLNFISINERGHDEGTQFVDQAYINITEQSCVLVRYGLSIEKHSMRISCDSQEAVNLQVNYEALKGVINNIAKRFDEVEFTQGKSNTLVITAGRLRTELKLAQVEAPAAEEVEDMHEMSVPVAELERLLKIAKSASAKNDIRYYLNGVCLSTDENGTLRAIGTDGHRLSISKCEYRAAHYDQNQIILSNDAVGYVEAILKLATDDDINFQFSSNSVAIKLQSGASLNSKVIEGAYPDWRRVVPMTTECMVTFRKCDLLESLRSALPMTNPKFRGGKLEFGDGVCKIFANNEIGNYEDEIEAVGVDIKPIAIGFNLEYIISALNTLNGPNIVLGFNNESAATTIIEAEDPQGVQVVMPIRI